MEYGALEWCKITKALYSNNHHSNAFALLLPL
jgi:hypothetical protein